MDFGGDSDNDKVDNDYGDGVLLVEFIYKINEEKAGEIIAKYNLTILDSELDKIGYVEHSLVEVPRNKELYYAEILIQDTYIKDVYRSGSY